MMQFAQMEAAIKCCNQFMFLLSRAYAWYSEFPSGEVTVRPPPPSIREVKHVTYAAKNQVDLNPYKRLLFNLRTTIKGIFSLSFVDLLPGADSKEKLASALCMQALFYSLNCFYLSLVAGNLAEKIQVLPGFSYSSGLISC